MRGRWDDWAAVAAGLAACVSWLWHGMLGTPMAALFLLGMLTLFAAVMSLTRPGLIATEAVVLVAGVLMFCTPWAFGFADDPAAAWTAWLLGAAIAVLGVVGLPSAIGAHGRAAHR